MSWPDGELYSCPLQSLVVSLLLSLASALLFSRTGGVLSHRNSLTHRFPFLDFHRGTCAPSSSTLCSLLSTLQRTQIDQQRKIPLTEFQAKALESSSYSFIKSASRRCGANSGYICRHCSLFNHDRENPKFYISAYTLLLFLSAKQEIYTIFQSLIRLVKGMEPKSNNFEADVLTTTRQRR